MYYKCWVAPRYFQACEAVLRWCESASRWMCARLWEEAFLYTPLHMCTKARRRIQPALDCTKWVWFKADVRTSLSWKCKRAYLRPCQNGPPCYAAFSNVLDFFLVLSFIIIIINRPPSTTHNWYHQNVRLVTQSTQSPTIITYSCLPLFWMTYWRTSAQKCTRWCPLFLRLRRLSLQQPFA